MKDFITEQPLKKKITLADLQWQMKQIETYENLTKKQVETYWKLKKLYHLQEASKVNKI